MNDQVRYMTDQETSYTGQTHGMTPVEYVQG